MDDQEQRGDDEIPLVYYQEGYDEVVYVSRDATEFTLSHPHINHIELEPLSECTNLEILNLSENISLSDLDLSPLASCKSLHTLNLGWNTRLGEIDFSPLSGLENLRIIDLHGIPANDLSSIAYCKSLEKLNLAELRRGMNLDLSFLSHCKQLRHLDLSSNKFLTSDSIVHIGNSTKLWFLNLTGCSSLKSIDLTPLCSCFDLMELRLPERSQIKFSLDVDTFKVFEPQFVRAAPRFRWSEKARFKNGENLTPEQIDLLSHLVRVIWKEADTKKRSRAHTIVQYVLKNLNLDKLDLNDKTPPEMMKHIVESRDEEQLTLK